MFVKTKKLNVQCYSNTHLETISLEIFERPSDGLLAFLVEDQICFGNLQLARGKFGAHLVITIKLLILQRSVYFVRGRGETKFYKEPTSSTLLTAKMLG